MPVYEYVCKSCGHHLEVSQSFSDAPLTTCPACEGPLRKVFSSVGIMFKGSGFYRTDSRVPSGKAAKDGAKDAAPADKPAGEKPAAGAEAAPAPAAEKKAESKASESTATKSGDVAKSA